MEAAFPSRSESTAASALLLLSHPQDSKKMDEESLGVINSRSCSSPDDDQLKPKSPDPEPEPEREPFFPSSGFSVLWPISSSVTLACRAEDILKLLSARPSGASESKIRRLLGDTPDTSKALRMLVELEKVKRSGAGGRPDPYIYTV